jgi:hypothetical protein
MEKTILLCLIVSAILLLANLSPIKRLLRTRSSAAGGKHPIINAPMSRQA